MCKVKIIFYVLLIFLLRPYLNSELPAQLMDISLGENLKELKQKLRLRRVRTKCEVDKTYEIVYTEELSLKITISVFQSKVYKIQITYNENLIDESDWQSVYDRAKDTYGLPTKVYVDSINDKITENYLWENGNVKHIYQRIILNDKLKNFNILLVDVKTEQKISKLPRLKRFYYKIMNLF
ncbi:MAG: hypothetical protein NZ928_01025 [Endomicrobia bacterium]|nr:hypothetical protein [Endomicrobiia bacterium]MCX7941081.1 hypothetical protein [Endomicrobiia bacterium]MDW8055383.1 hypothetical protein [Elusimicrobiota bacterium]